MNIAEMNLGIDEVRQEEYQKTQHYAYSTKGEL